MVSLVALSGLTACELTDDQKAALDGAFAAPGSSGYDGNPVALTPECFSERYMQPDAQVAKSLDLLFVTDTSGSLDVERASIAQGIDAFVAELPADVDYRIAILLGHGSRSSKLGKLWTNSGHPAVLDSRALSLSQIRSHLSYNLTHVAGDMYSDGGEEGLFALKTALSGAKLDAIRAQGFVRPDAALAVVFVSDEQDICYDYPADVTPVPDPDRLEGPAKARDCAGVTPASVLAAVKAAKGDLPYLIGGVVYNNLATYVRQGENELGYGYLDLIRLVSGISVDIAGSSYVEGLAQLGSLARVKLQLLSDFTLARQAQEIDAASLKVYVDGALVDFSYSASTNEVHVAEPGMARSVVDISYCRVPAPPADGGCSGPTCGGGVIGI